MSGNLNLKQRYEYCLAKKAEDVFIIFSSEDYVVTGQNCQRIIRNSAETALLFNSYLIIIFVSSEGLK